jgi:hypothetical protein
MPARAGQPLPCCLSDAVSALSKTEMGQRLELQQALVREADNVPAAASRPQRAAAGYAGALAAIQLGVWVRAIRYASTHAPNRPNPAPIAPTADAQTCASHVIGHQRRQPTESGAGVGSGGRSCCCRLRPPYVWGGLLQNSVSLYRLRPFLDAPDGLFQKKIVGQPNFQNASVL